jgi:signal transduction histidine kinase
MKATSAESPDKMSRDELVRELTELRAREKELLAAIQARDNLLAVVAHDLRSPLQAVLMSARLLTMSPREGERRQNRKQIDVILRSSARMSDLVSDLLQAATIQAGTFTIAPCSESIVSIVEEAVQALHPVAAAKSIRLITDVPSDLPAAHCDRARVTQVLHNLIGNAVKFVQPEGQIIVRAWVEGAQLCIAVADTGPGIANDQVTHLFDRYWRGRPAGAVGAGLGLYIAKGIVEAHGGTLAVDSQVEVGSTFRFTIPIAKDGAEH